MSKHMDFCKLLEKIANKHYASQNHLSYETGVSYSTIYRAYVGETSLSKRSLDKFITASKRLIENKKGISEEERKLDLEDLELLLALWKAKETKIANVVKYPATLQNVKNYHEEIAASPIITPLAKNTNFWLAAKNLVGAIGFIVILSISISPFLQNPAKAGELDENPTESEIWIPVYETFNGIEMAKVPAGCFIMGNLRGRDDEQPLSEVCFEAPFWIARTETTIEQYGSAPDETCNTNQASGNGLVNGIEANFPRNCVTWEEANLFCESKEMRLPSEAEWEYAGRGWANLLYPWGDDPIAAYAIVRTNFNDAAVGAEMLPVGSKPQDISWTGVYDMAGSLQEFTSTIYDTVTLNGAVQFGYPYNAEDGRETLQNTGTSDDIENRNETTTLRVVRGGSFDWGIERATLTTRRYEFYDFRWNAYGFRCVKDA